MADEHFVRCRAQLGDVGCVHGKPTRFQFGDDEPLSEDATYDGDTIVCDPCYSALMPFTISGRALHEEIPAAIDNYRNVLQHIRGHARPEELVEEADGVMEKAADGTPLWFSARASKRMAEREIDYRAKAAA